jgi:hypothetical protein
LQFFLFNGTSREVLGGSFSPNVKLSQILEQLVVLLYLIN